MPANRDPFVEELLERNERLTRRVIYLQRDNAVLREQHRLWREYATTDLTPAAMESRLREIEHENGEPT